ncbi:MAG: histidine triad nucleotide-binding protein [Candidatus Kapaibacterium sp.]|nr:MAG: histidine triad nucleotide-binding protein [Candidatus Kapabacteria bacterium]
MQNPQHDSIFLKIIRREIPATIEFEDDDVIAIHDINPVAPIHILIIPKKLIPTVNDIEPEDAPLVGKMFLVAKQIAAAKGLAERGYRLVMNVGKDGGQTVYHIHLHLIGGKALPFATA